VDGKEYQFRLAKFFVPGVGYRTAEEALADKPILGKLEDKFL